MLDIIKDLLDDLETSVIKTDFEISAINALKLHFPNARISGCLFHLGQAIDRKLKGLDLANIYATDFAFKNYTKALISIAYVKLDSLDDKFNLLKTSRNFPVSAISLYDYFYRNYISPFAGFPPQIWHSLNIIVVNIPRTNNAVEGWHNTFANTFFLCKYSLYMLFCKSKDEEDVIRIRSLQQVILGHVFERKNKYILREERLTQYLTENFNQEEDIEFIFDIVAILNCYV